MNYVWIYLSKWYKTCHYVSSTGNVRVIFADANQDINNFRHISSLVSSQIVDFTLTGADWHRYT